MILSYKFNHNFQVLCAINIISDVNSGLKRVPPFPCPGFKR